MSTDKTKFSDECEVVVANAETGEIKQKVKSYPEKTAQVLTILRGMIHAIERKSSTVGPG